MSKLKMWHRVAQNKWDSKNDDVMTCMHTMRYFGVYCVSRKLSDYTPSTIGDSWGSNERKIIIGAPTFNESKCGGNPGTSREFKNSVGNSIAWDLSGTESKDQYCILSPGNCSTRVVLMASVFLVRRAKIQRSDNHIIFVKLDSKSE